jgi:ribosome-associated protein
MLPSSALRLQYARSSGPGGQNVNKVNTKAELWLRLDELGMLNEAARQRLRRLAGKRRVTRDEELHLTSDTQRTQEGNREALMQRLRELLIAAMVEPKTRRKTRPSRAAKQRRLESKRRRGEVKARRQRPLD